MRRALVVGMLVGLAFPAGAFGHASLITASPDYRQRVEQGPHAVVLRFSQVISLMPETVSVTDSSGRRVPAAVRLAADRRSFSARLTAKLPRGAYTVRWNVLSASDGHVVSGIYTFGVRVAAPPPTEAVGAGGPTGVEKLVRWLSYLGLALLAGGIAVRLLALPPELPERIERRLYALLGIGVLLAVNAGMAGFLLRADSVLQVSFERFLYADLSPFATGTRFGGAWVWMTLGTVLAGLLVAGSWLIRRREPLTLALAVALVLGSGFALSGHSASEPNASALSVVADWAHIAAASVWIGGLVTLAAVVWPSEPGLRRRAFLRFSRLATALVGVVLIGGVYLGVLRLAERSDLWETAYGRVLMLKVGLVALALTWGAAHHFIVRPRIEASTGIPGGRIGRSLLGEGVVGAAVLLIAAVLVNTAPPPPVDAPERTANVAAVASEQNDP